MNNKLTFLGTGHGMPFRSSSSAMFLESGLDNILLDCSGGYEIIRRLTDANIEISSIKNIFISHYDADHILGIVPLVRLISHFETTINLIVSQSTLDAVNSLFALTAHKEWEMAQEKLNIVVVKDAEQFETENMLLEFIDNSSSRPLLGVKITFENGYTIFYPGDKAIKESFYDKIMDVDLLIHDAFCLNEDAEKYDLKTKHHSTVREAAENASRIKAKSLALFHMEDDTLATRKERYLKEAIASFAGDIIVPVDLDIINID